MRHVRRLAAALGALALLAPAAALAHGSIVPAAAPAGGEQRFVLTIPNTLQGGPQVIEVAVTAPEGVELLSAEANQPRWTARVSGQTVTWEGGPIEGLGEDFAFRATMPEAEGTYTFLGREGYAGGVGAEFSLAVVVTQGAGAAAASSPDDGLAWIAIALAATALLLALAAVAGAALLWRRLPADDRGDGVGELRDGGGALEPAPDHALAVDDEDPRL